MNQSELYLRKLAQGESTSIYALDASNTGYTHSIHTILILGTYSDSSTITANGIQMTFSGGMEIKQFPIVSISADVAPEGILLIGKKTRKTLFN
jgi:hypothetical protein